VSLLRNRTISALLAAETISTTGAQMTWVALPWFVLTTTGSPGRMTLVMGAEVLGLALFSMPSATLLRKIGSRRQMLVCDAARAPLMLAIPVLHWAGALSLGAIVALAFVLGAFAAAYFPAQRLIIPDILGDDETLVSRANALVQAATRTTLLAGPPLAGLLIAWLDAPTVLVIDAATYVVSFVLVALFVPERDRAPDVEEERGVLAGFRFLARERLLRVWAVSLTLGDMAWTAFFVSIPVLVVARFGENPRIVGFLFAAFGLGAVGGNAVAYRAVGRVQGLRLIGLVSMFQALPLWLLPIEVPAWALFAAIAASGVANGLVNPSLHSLIALRIPPALRPKVMAAWGTGWAVAAPLGLLAAGPVLELWGAKPVLAGVAAMQTLMMAALAASSLREHRLAPPGAAPEAA
jgi:MFS family permease